MISGHRFLGRCKEGEMDRADWTARITKAPSGWRNNPNTGKSHFLLNTSKKNIQRRSGLILNIGIRQLPSLFLNQIDRREQHQVISNSNSDQLEPNYKTPRGSFETKCLRWLTCRLLTNQCFIHERDSKVCQFCGISFRQSFIS